MASIPPMTATTKPTRPHFTRTPKPYVFQERDFHLIRLVWENRFLTKDLFLLFYPPDPTKTPAHVRTDTPKRAGTNLERRLSTLYHAGYLTRFRKELRGTLIYAITNKGAELLRERQLPLFSATDWNEANRDLSRAYTDHTLMTARFRASLAVATRDHPHVFLTAYERESTDLKAEWKRGHMRVYVNPDAFFTLKDDAQPAGQQFWPYFLEADQSTMTLERMMEKYARYSLMLQDKKHQDAFDIQSFRVLTIAKSRQRASNLVSVLHETTSVPLPDPETRKRTPYPFPAEHKKFFYFTTEETYTEAPANVLASIWRRADNITEQRAIIASPLARVQ